MILTTILGGCGRGMWLGVEMYLGEALCGISMSAHNVYYVKSRIWNPYTACPFCNFWGWLFTFERIGAQHRVLANR